MFKEFKMKIIEGDLIMTEDMTFDDDLKVNGNIYGKDGIKYDLNCGNLNCLNLNCENLTCLDLNCENLNCWDLNCWDLTCFDLTCRDLNCGNLNCWDLTFYAVAIAYKSFKCKTWKARRQNYIIKCLDGEIKGEQKK